MAWYDFLKNIFGGGKDKSGEGNTETTPPSTPNQPVTTPQAPQQTPVITAPVSPPPSPVTPTPYPRPPLIRELEVRRHFYNQPSFQTYGSFFAHWGGWITAGHVLTSAADIIPPFANGHVQSWPLGLDAAVMGCTLPSQPPKPPRMGQRVIIKGYPAGSRYLEERQAKVYYERKSATEFGSSSTWIAHILLPDEPVVTGMSGGVVVDAQSNIPIGILITRNSPADLDSDQDPDESCDFVALSDVWHALSNPDLVV